MDKTDEPPERSRAARRASETRERLLNAALAVINTHGFDGCSVEDITELADVGKGTFYRHFTDKSAVLRDLLEAALGNLRHHMQASLSQATSIETAALAVLKAHTEGFVTRPDLYHLFLQAQQMAATRPAATQELGSSLSAYSADVEKGLSPFFPAGTSEAARRRLTLAASSAVAAFVVAALSSSKGLQEIAGNLESLSQAFVAGIPRLLQG